MKYVCYFLFIFSLLSLSSCGSLPEISNCSVTKIATPYGPEDILVDSVSMPTNRLLISCSSRRKEDTDSLNGIYAYDFISQEVKPMKRVGEPANLEFHSHGFDIAFVHGHAFLYVINHQDEIGVQSILVYRVLRDSLVFDTMIQNPKIISPNDIFVCEDGSFFLTNDAGKRGSKMELILGQKKGSVLYFSNKWQEPVFVDEHLGYPNGIYYLKPYLYVSTISEGILYRYKKMGDQFVGKTALSDQLKGGDNINPYKGGLLVATHPRFMAFMRHKSKSSNHSPSLIYYYKNGHPVPQIVFFDDGARISAASTALIYHHKLYLSQVFDPFILRVDIPGPPD